MRKGQPISPAEIPAAKQAIIPGFVFDAFNECIAANWSGGSARVLQKDVVAKIKASPDYTEPFKYEWLNVEEAYRASGFHVTYDKPAYCETYDPLFEFSKKK
jgi:hypothetical protein